MVCGLDGREFVNALRIVVPHRIIHGNGANAITVLIVAAIAARKLFASWVAMPATFQVVLHPAICRVFDIRAKLDLRRDCCTALTLHSFGASGKIAVSSR
jgi:hypothetical protein